MTTKNDKKSDATPHSTKKQTNGDAKSSQSSVKLYCTYLGGIGFILALFSSIGVIYLANNLSSMDRGINQELELTNNTIASLVEQQKNQNTTLNNQQSILEQNKKYQEKQLRELESQLDQSLKEQGYQTEHWQLLKARYFLEMAQINAYWQQESSVTLAMLQQADRILKSFHNQTIYKVRQILAKEMTDLQTMQTPDTIGLLSQLDALREQVRSIPTHKPIVNSTMNSSNEPSPEKNASNGWRERWANSVNLLEKLVVIRYHHDDKTSVMTPAAQEVLIEHVSLSLQQAQWGVMQKNQAVYQHALQESIRQLQPLSAQHQETIRGIIAQLTELSQMSVAFKQPTPNEALKQLNAFIKNEIAPPTPSVNTNKKEDASL